MLLTLHTLHTDTVQYTHERPGARAYILCAQPKMDDPWRIFALVASAAALASIVAELRAEIGRSSKVRQGRAESKLAAERSACGCVGGRTCERLP